MPTVVLLNKNADTERKTVSLKPVSEKKVARAGAVFFGAPLFVPLVTTCFTIYMRIIYKL